MRRTLLGFTLGLFLPALIYAQQWELGGAAGYGIYRNGSIIAPDGTAKAGFRDRFAVGAVLGEDLYEHLSGEFHYVYQDGDPFLEQGNVKANLQGQSHTFAYDLLFHFTPREANVRPYLAAGGGGKLYVVSGPLAETQPLANIGLLTTHDQWEAVLSLGGGIKFKLSQHVLFRVDFRDYITRFPKRLIAPVEFATARGVLHQYTPSAGISYTF